MSKFSIIPNGGGTARYSGCPTYTGTYLKPGVLEFREIASPTPIEWAVGDYVAYTRTGFTYRLYSIPQVKKQARSTEYGGAFIYQNVQFFDDSKQLDICPFRDLVLGDNRVHFSTQPSISTFEDVGGIARRLQACLDDMYPDSWVVRLATTEMGASQDLVDLMAEARDFTVSGVSLLGALEKVYEVWPEVGWVFSREQVTIDGSSVWRNIITIGGAGLNSPDSYQYGKGNGLRSITRTVANADEMATRIFAYGSVRNMLPKWYNSQNIKDAESVDIQNLMLPIGPVGTQGDPDYYPGWGETDDLPDAAKAFLDAAPSVMAKLGLRPKTYYFDGTGDLPEIYPTIRQMTIKEVRDSKSSSSDPYYPDETIYLDEDARVDTILSAPLSFDSGMAGENGKSSVANDSTIVSQVESLLMPANVGSAQITFLTRTFTIGETGDMNLEVNVELSGSTIDCDFAREVYLMIITTADPGTPRTLPLEQNDSGDWVLGNYSTLPMAFSGTSGQTITVSLALLIYATASTSARTFFPNIVGELSASVSRKREKTFKIGIRQIGFDINAQADLGDGKTISMRSGKCAGRSFSIKSCTYVESSDSWLLEVIRSNDDSLSQWFPNTDYPIEAGNEFVLLDIAMPDEYVLVAEKRLLQAAQELLADVSVERWQYTPEIDAKFMVENSRTILPAQNMQLVDANIVENGSVSILIDTVTINEGEAAIPVYKVTLRDRKKKTFTEAKGIDNMSSNPVTNSTQEAIRNITYSGGGDSYFTLDENGNVTLKEAYLNLWVPGWLAAGGVSNEGGGGGGGLITSVKGVSDLGTPIVTEDLTQTFSAKAIESIYEAVQSLQQSTPNVNLTSGQTNASLTVNGTTVDFYTKGQTDALLANVDVNVLYRITTEQDGIVKFEWANGDVVNVDLNHTHSDYVPITTTINGVDLSQSRNFYTLGTAISGTKGPGVLYEVNAISHNADSVTEQNDVGRIVWDPNAGGTGIGAWRIKGNLYADGWIAAGGIGAGGGGGSGVIFLNSSLEDVSVNTSTLADGQILQWDGTNNLWKNVSLSVTVNPATANSLGGVMVGSVISTPTIQTISSVANRYYYVQCDATGLAFVNVPWTPGSSGGSSVSIDNLLSSGTRIATLTIDGTTYDILAPTSGTPGSGETDPVFSASAAYGITSADITAWNAKVDASTLADYALKTGANTYNFLVNTLKFSIGTVAAQNYSISGISKPRLKWTYTYEDEMQVGNPLVTETKYLAYRDEIPSTLKNPYALTFGSYTYDGSAARTLTASSIGAVTLAGAETITGVKTFSAAIVMGADIYPSTDLGASLGYGNNRFNNANIQNIGTTNIYLKNSTTGNNSGMFAATDGWMMIRAGANTSVENSYKQINFHPTYGFYPNSAGINLGYTGSTNRWENIYGVNADLTGDLKMATTSHIDIGPVRIEYDSVNGALHITTNVTSGTIPNIGLYADGFVSSGGIQQTS